MTATGTKCHCDYAEQGRACKTCEAISMTPTYLHISVNGRTRQAKICEMFGLLQYYHGAVRKPLLHKIVVPFVMVHIFVTEDFEIDRLRGLEIKGYDVEYGARLGQDQIAFLQSRVR